MPMAAVAGIEAALTSAAADGDLPGRTAVVELRNAGGRIVGRT